MTHFIALEAHFLGTVETLMGVLSAENAVILLGVVGTFLGHVSKLSAVVTLDGGVLLCPVPRPLHLHQCTEVVFAVFISSHFCVFL